MSQFYKPRIRSSMLLPLRHRPFVARCLLAIFLCILPTCLLLNGTRLINAYASQSEHRGVINMHSGKAAQALHSVVSIFDSHPEFFDKPNVVGMKNFTQLSFNLPYEREWREYPHLVVYGVLATDKSERRSIRDMQRSTWLRYPDVATKWNAFEGLMLVLYPTAPFAPISPNITVAMMKEMNMHHDVLLLRMKEEAPTESKALGQLGRYGLPFHVSNTRKLLFYLLYAHYAFPTTPFIAKGDDDSYVYVPEYMRMVRQLPRINVVYGPVSKPYRLRRFQMTYGYSYLISRDVVHSTVADDMVDYLLKTPFAEGMDDLYSKIGFVAEDWLVGLTLHRHLALNPLVRRVLPLLPPADDRLPPVEGWGMHYMEYVLNREDTARTGRAVSSDGRYNLTYIFPPPCDLNPGNVLWVDDKCRIQNQRWPNATKSRPIVAHRLTTSEQFRAYNDYHRLLGEDADMVRPTDVNVTSLLFYSDVTLGGMGLCAIDFNI